MLKRLFIAFVTVTPFLLFSVGSHVIAGGAFEPGDQTNAPGSTSSSSYTMTCDAASTYNQCVEYTFDNEEDFNATWDECAFTKSEGHGCSRGGTWGECKHTNSDSTTCSVIYGTPRSEVESSCSSTQGTFPC